MASQLTYDFEFDCSNLINHVSHWPSIDFVATKAPAQNIDGLFTIYSRTMPLCTGVYKRCVELRPITETQGKLMDDPKFGKLIPFATRLKAILLHVTPEGEKADDDLDSDAFDLLLQNLESMNLSTEEIKFFDQHSELIEKVSTVMGRTLLTLDEFKQKWNKVLKGKTIKLLQMEECKVAFVAPNPVRGGQIAHGQSPSYVRMNPRDGIAEDPVNLLVDSFSASSLASPPPKKRE